MKSNLTKHILFLVIILSVFSSTSSSMDEKKGYSIINIKIRNKVLSNVSCFLNVYLDGNLVYTKWVNYEGIFFYYLFSDGDKTLSAQLCDFNSTKVTEVFNIEYGISYYLEVEFNNKRTPGIIKKVSEMNVQDESSIKRLDRWPFMTANELISDSLHNFGILQDTRDGHIYKTVKINNQVWMAENLMFKTPEGSWCCEKNENNCYRYGRLYNWPTACVVCPEGWHLPNYQELNFLLNNFGGEGKTAYTQLMLGGESGFDALLGGGSDSDYSSSYSYLEKNGYYWSSNSYSSYNSSTNTTTQKADHLTFGNVFSFGILSAADMTRVAIGADECKCGFSVRCIADSTYSMSMGKNEQTQRIKNYESSDGREAEVYILTDQNILADIAKNDKDSIVREIAVNKLNEYKWPDLIAEIAKNDESSSVRYFAVKKLNDQNTLAHISKYDKNKGIRAIALSKLDTKIYQDLLKNISINDENDWVREIANKKLKELKK